MSGSGFTTLVSCMHFCFFQSESIVRIVDAKILDQGPRAAFILMELGEMDFDTYLQSSAPAADGIMPHCQGQGFHGGEKNM